MEQLFTLSILFLLLAFTLGLLERFFPAVKPKPAAFLRAGFLIDLTYWFFNPVVTKAVTTFCAGMVIFFVVRLSGLDFDTMKVHGFGPVASQPMWLIVLEMLVLGDLIGYWIHRAFHQFPDLWDIHVIHHSSEDLDWLSAVRVHPLNDIIPKTLRVIPFVLLGFPLTALAAYIPLLLIFAIFIHSNVPWSFGPLRFVFASPNFHRWHHTARHEGLNKNFSGLFPVFDWLFGTLYLPARSPGVFGVKENIPQGFWGQLVYPFKPDRTPVTDLTTGLKPTQA